MLKFLTVRQIIHHPIATAFAMSLGAALSLGMARFSYALLLPAMRADLHWSYLLAGAMNTANAFGYLLGALATPLLLRRFKTQSVLIGGAVLTALFMLASGIVTDTGVLLMQRTLAGISSAMVFVSGGLLAVRLGAMQPQRAGLLIGIYYGGTGIGIVIATLLIPNLQQFTATRDHPWQLAWRALAVLCLLATIVMACCAGRVDGRVTPAGSQATFQWRLFRYSLAGYFLYGTGYIGYMTFVIALLREQGMSAASITWFYALLGAAIICSSRLWARLLDRFRGGQALALLCGLLALATAVPAMVTDLTAAPVLVFASGILFGAVFLSVVAATTALVRHNAPAPAWPAGIGAFTSVFAAGQIIGPSCVGWIADQTGGLQTGLLFSALALVASAVLCLKQKEIACAAAIQPSH